jgi:rubredoxin
MASLPRSYVNVVRKTTGYWGAFPLSQELAPGMIGRKVNGTFRRETDLTKLDGYDPVKFAAPVRAEKVSADAYVSDGVQFDRVDVGADGGGLPLGGRFRLSFSNAGQGAVACRGTREWEFDDLRAVKGHVISLFRRGLWDLRDILVVRVLLVDVAWVMVASQRGQSVELSLSGALAPPIAGARDLLKAVIGAGTLDLAYGAFGSVGYSGELSKGGTPLFEAIKLKRFPRLDMPYVRGPESPFEEADFEAMVDDVADRIFVCDRCREFNYDENRGYIAGGIPKGARWEDISDQWGCPVCGATKAHFKIVASG